MEIKTSWDYGKFKRIPGNRPVDEKRVQKIVVSVNGGLDLIDSNPVRIYEEEGSWWMVDGQHRYEACVKLQRPVPYIIVPKMEIEQIAELNSNQAAWSGKNYLDTFCERGIESYIQLRDFMKTFGLNISIAKLLLNPSWGQDKFKNGTWKIIRYEKAITAGKILKDYFALTKQKDRYLAEAVLKLIDNKDYDHKIMKHKLQETDTEFVKKHSTTDYLRQIEEVYNFKAREKVRFF